MIERIHYPEEQTEAMYDDTVGKLVEIPNTKPNFKLEVKVGGGVTIGHYFRERKTLKNRIKWWLLCKTFPLEIIRWDKEE